MPRYFLHLQLGDELVEDEAGETYATLDEARVDAIRAAREIMSDRISRGKEPDGGVIRIADEAGKTLMLVPFRDAIG